MKKVVALAIVVVLVVGGWTAAWLYFSEEIRKNILALAQADGVTGPRLTCGNLDIGGYPFRFNVVCQTARLVSGDINATLPELRATAAAYQPTHLRFSAKGPIELSDAFAGSRSRIDWTGLEASVRLEGFRVERVSLIGDNLTLTDTLAGETQLGTAAHMEAHLVDIPEQRDPQRQLAALAAYAKINGFAAPGLQIAAGNGTFEAEISGLPDDARALFEPSLLQRWQATGGTLRIVGLNLADGDVTLQSTGDLALDPQGLAQGQLAITSRGVVERLGALVDPAIAPLIFGGPDAEGTYRQNLTLNAGTVSSGLVPIFTLPPVF